MSDSLLARVVSMSDSGDPFRYPLRSTHRVAYAVEAAYVAQPSPKLNKQFMLAAMDAELKEKEDTIRELTDEVAAVEAERKKLKTTCTKLQAKCEKLEAKLATNGAGPSA